MMSRLFLLVKRHKLLIGIWLVAIFTQGLPLLTSYWYSDGNLLIATAHDSLFHIGLIHEITQRFPPENPGISGVPLQNYHYFSDIFLSLFTYLTIPEWFIYYRIGPVLASTAFVFSAWFFSSQITKSKLGRYFATVCILFGGSLGYLAKPLGLSAVNSTNVFMLDQPFEMLTNVHTFFGFSLFLFGAGLYFYGTKHKKFGILMLSSVIFGLVYGIKAYASLIGLIGIGSASLWHTFKTKNIQHSVASILPGAMIFTLLFTSTNAGSGGLVFGPGWLLVKMVEDGDRLGKLGFLSARRLLYLQEGSYLKAAVVYGLKSVIFIVGNLGPRIIAFILFFLWAKNYKKITNKQVFLVTSTAASLGLPLFFYQANTAYNIVQFAPYSLMITAGLLGVVLEKISEKQKKYFFVITVLLLLVPTTINTTYRQLDIAYRTEKVSQAEKQAYDKLKNETRPESIVLIHPESKHGRLMYIPGLALRRTYYSGETYADLTGANVTERLHKLDEFFDASVSATNKREFLAQNSIDYIYLDTIHKGLLRKQADEIGMEEFFKNEDVFIYSISF